MVFLMIEKWHSGIFQVEEFVLFQSISLLLIHRLWEFGRNFRSLLFHRSIRENINLGDELLNNVADKSQSLKFINKLPDKFETLVGERDVKLSGRERQRIAIARAFLEDTPIVVLDEATSALDSLTEKQIQVAIFY